jgi:hypothetical protein
LGEISPTGNKTAAQYDLYKGFFSPYFFKKRKKQQSPDLDSESV